MERRLKTHDANQLQLKLGYQVDPGVRYQHYLIELYMFVPRTLGIGKHSYSQSSFYRDTQTLVRLSPPSVALEALAQKGRAKPWFKDLSSKLNTLLGGAKVPIADTVRSIKVLGCIYQTAIRDETKHLRERLQRLESDDESARHAQEQAFSEALESFVERLEAALSRLRACGDRCLQAVVPDDIRVTWEVVDEFLALYAEEAFTELVAQCDAQANGRSESPLRTARKRMAEAAVAAYTYRRSRGYASFVVPGTSNETLPWRRRVLKRIIHSALYLETRYDEGGTVPNNIIAGVAAAIAMLFAVVVLMWATVEWGAVSSMFLIVAVLSYIIKDRLKEMGRRYLGQRFRRWMPDYLVNVRDPQTGRILGRSRESMSIVDSSAIDREVFTLRHADHPSEVARQGRAENVVRFVKDVRLSSKRLDETIHGVNGISDIIRINFNRFRQRMDEPIEIHRVVDPETLELVNVPCSRIYHINLVLRITRGKEQKHDVTTERVRVVLDQDGLKRVEHIDGFAGEDVDLVMGSMPLEGPSRVITVIDGDDVDEAVAATT